MSRLNPYIEYLYEALALPLGHGVILQTSNIELTKQRLYQARKTDPAFAAIAILSHRLEPQSKLVLVQKGEEDAEGASPEEDS